MISAWIMGILIKNASIMWKYEIISQQILWEKNFSQISAVRTGVRAYMHATPLLSCMIPLIFIFFTSFQTAEKIFKKNYSQRHSSFQKSHPVFCLVPTNSKRDVLTMQLLAELPLKNVAIMFHCLGAYIIGSSVERCQRWQVAQCLYNLSLKNGGDGLRN